MRRREVLPLKAGVRQLLLHGPDELIDEVEVGRSRHPLVPPAEVLGIIEPLGVVGPHVQHDRQRPLGADPADERVQGELADGDAQAAGPLVADAQDALAVGDDDDVHLRVGTVAQQRRDRVAQRIGDEQAARSSVDVAELLTGLRDHRRVDDGRHLLDVVEEEPVEEDFVGVLQGAQVDVPLEVVVFPTVGLVGADHLLIQALDLRRQQPVQAEPAPLALRECRALVQGRVVEEIDATGAVSRS